VTSYEVAERLFGADHPAGGHGFFGATGVNLIRDNAVLLFVNFGQKPEPELGELGFVESAFEDAVLDADAEVFADAGDAGEAFFIGDVIGEEGQHFLFSGWAFLIGDEGEGVEPPCFIADLGWRIADFRLGNGHCDLRVAHCGSLVSAGGVDRADGEGEQFMTFPQAFLK
jgi:hypothetical protein